MIRICVRASSMRVVMLVGWGDTDKLGEVDSDTCDGNMIVTLSIGGAGPSVGGDEVVKVGTICFLILVKIDRKFLMSS